MKKVYSLFKTLLLLTCMSIITQQDVNAQCSVVSQGAANDPTCSYQAVNGGAGAYWTLNVTNNVLYSFYWTPSGCSDVTDFCVQGNLETNSSSAAPSVFVAVGTGSWDIGFYEANTTWCATSAVLNYEITPPSVFQGSTTSATVCASTGSYTIPTSPTGYSYDIGGYTGYGSVSWGTSGDGTFINGNTTDPTYVFGALDIANGGLITLTMTADNGGCTANTTFALTIDPSPTTATVGPTQNICGSLTSGSLGGNSPAIGTGAWSQASGPGTSTFNPNNTSPSASATATAYGTYVYTWTISNGVCASSSANETVNYYSTPSSAVVGPTQNLCGTLNTTLTGTAPASGTGTWTQTSGPGTTTFGNANSGSSTATVTAYGTYVYTWTVSNGSCPSNSTTLTVNYYQTPTTATAAGTLNVCGSLVSPALGGNTPTVGSGTWAQVSGPGSTFFSNANSGSSTAAVGSAGTYIFSWTITNGICSSVAYDTVNYYNTPTTATVGSQQNICGSLTSASLGGNTPAANSGTGLWTQTSGPGTTVFSNANSGSSTATASLPGSYTYTWTISNGTCTSSSASIVVDFVSTPSGGSIPNVSYCASANSGVVTVVGVSNATEYQWSLPAGLSGSSTTASITVGGNVPNTYTVTVTPIDTAFGITCTGTAITGTVTILALPVIDSVNSHNITCFGSTDSIVVYATSSNGSLSYSINGGTSYPNSTGVFPGVTAGTYNVFVQDDSGCSVGYNLNPVIITQPANGLMATSIATPVGCNGDSNGTINLLASGGAGGYLYSWSSGQNIQIIQHLGAGIYSGTVTDLNGCIATVTDTLVSPPAIIDTITKTDVTCFDYGNGTATVSISGGIPPYQILWDNFDTTAHITRLSVGVYRVRIIDSFGCVHLDSIRIKRPPLLTATLTANNIPCFGTNTDTLLVSVTGGNPGGYTYTWSPAVGTDSIAIGVPPGSYEVTVTDTKGCFAKDSVTITQPLTPVSAISITTPVGCNGDTNGTINVLASGGVGGYTYDWSSGQTVQFISGLGQGTYTCSVTDANGCVATVTDVLQKPAVLLSGIEATNVSCNGGNNGTLFLTVVGGVAPYSILWTNFDTSYFIGGVTAGQYGVMITDSYGCKQIDTITVTQPSQMVATVSVVNIGCSGATTGSVTVTVTGGTPGVGGYIYTWAPPVVSTTDSATGLAAGTYTVTISDSLGCSITASGTVTQTGSAMSLTSIVKPVTCNNDSNGSITVLASGGTGGYTYSWTGTSQTSSEIVGLPAGIYTVTVSSGGGCSATLSDTLLNPALISASITKTNVTCYDSGNGTAQLIVSGGVAPYSILWNNFDTTFNITHLEVGYYRVQITDANGCVIYDSTAIARPTLLEGTLVVSNVKCFGTNVDTLDMIAIGGNAGAYTYTWSPSVGSGPIVTNVPPGEYFVTVTDVKGCIFVDSGTITQPSSALTLTSVVTNPGCSNSSSGSIFLEPSGGVGGYVFSWSNGDTTQYVGGLAIGTYSATVTDANGCTATVNDTINFGSPIPITDTIVGTNVSCAGGANGSATLTVSGGTPGYTFLWSNLDTSQDISNLTAGTYRVIITDANGCKAYDTIQITQPPALSVLVTVTNVACFGANTGEVKVTVNGGTPGVGGYTYSWSPIANSTNDLSGVGAGTYYVTVTDSLGCSITASGTVDQPLTAITIDQTVTTIKCSGDSNGVIALTVYGGGGGYVFNWSSGQTTSSISGIPAGIYTVSVTDANGCVATLSDTLVNPAPITDTIVSTNVQPCYGAHNGTATITVSGGVAPYTLSWSTGDTAFAVTHLAGDQTYEVTITDANGCTHIDSIRILRPTKLRDSLTVSNVLCAGSNIDTINVFAYGSYASGGYTYTWSPNVSSGSSVTNVAPGTYYVTVTDTAGCQVVDTATITQPLPLSATVTVTNVGCSGGNTGSVVVTVTGGTPGLTGYTYSWSPVASTTDSVSGVGTGTYTVTITDANGCTIAASGTVNQLSSNLAVTAIVTDITCNNSDNGEITVLASGGAGGYSYAWTGTAQTTSTITGLSAGTYTVTVTDANGCTVSLSEALANPTAITSSILGTNNKCATDSMGSATLTVSGGTPGYSFLWSNFDTAQNQTNLPAGLYRVVITDANGCKNYDSIIITAPQPLVATVTVTNVGGCNGGSTGSVIVNVSGGAGGYTYAWSPVASSTDSVSGVGAGTYYVTITDANGCTLIDSGTVTQLAYNLSAISIVTNITCNNANDGIITVLPSGGSGGYIYSWTGTAQTTSTVTGLSAGTYTVTVTDGNGCTTSLSDTLTNPAPITSGIAGVNDKCANDSTGSATLTVSGGTPGYTFLWSNFDTLQNQTNLAAGIYRVIVTDANGCKNYDSIVITAPQPVVVTDSVSPITCNNLANGAIILTVTGGTPAYTYTWTPSGPNSPNNTGLSAGTYSVTVSDVNGCSATASASFTNPNVLAVSQIFTQPSCNGYTNGTIDLFANGGTPAYSYAWSPAEPNSADITGLAAGIYAVTITDAHGCQVVDSINVSQPGPMYVSAIQKNVSCFDYNDGFILSTPYGGTTPYSYQWYLGTDSFAPIGPITENITQLAGGSYYLIVTDANGCRVPYTTTIVNPDSLTVTFSSTNLACANVDTGSAAVIVTGGTVPYQFLWNNFSTDSVQTGLSAGTYTVVVTDSNGCHKNQSVNITQPQPILITASATNILCFGANTGAISLAVSGGTPQFTYTWNTTPVQTGDTASGLTAGSYTVTVTDQNGCTVTDNVTLTSPDAVVVNTAITDPTCSGSDNGFISLDARGGVAPYLYTWSTTPVQTGNVANGLAAGTYIATITDANGCSLYDTATVVAPQPIVVTLASGVSGCAGGANGIAVIDATGGLMPYTYGIGDIIQPSDTFTGLAVGSYTAVVTDANGCIGTDLFSVNPIGSFTDTLTATPSIILAGETVQLYAHATSDTTIVSYTWFPADSLSFTACGGSSNCDSPTVEPQSTQSYIVTVINARGCIIQDTVLVKVSNTASAFIPSAFTPNGDGLNDNFEFAILGANTINVQIWNRWGELVFSNPAQPNGMNNTDGWDGRFHGKEVQQDTYTYQLVVSYFDGHTETIAGTVIVLR